MLRLDVLGLQAFVAVAESGSFVAAARNLHLSQTALTRRLQKLEEAVETRLVERTTRSLSLTKAGTELFPRALRLLREMAGVMEDTRLRAASDYETIELGCLPTVAASRLGAIVREHHERFPRSWLRVVDASMTEIRNAVLAGELDFAISALPTPHTDLVAELLFREPLMVVCRSDHRFAQQSSVAWEKLRGETLIGLHALSDNRRLLDDIADTHHLKFEFAYEVKHIATAVGLVAGGAGISVLTESACVGISPDRVTAIKMKGPEVSRSIELFRRRDRPLSPAASGLREILLATMRPARHVRTG